MWRRGLYGQGFWSWGLEGQGLAFTGLSLYADDIPWLRRFGRFSTLRGTFLWVPIKDCCIWGLYLLVLSLENTRFRSLGFRPEPFWVQSFGLND